MPLQVGSFLAQSVITNLTTDLAALPKGLIAAWTVAANTNSATTANELMLFTWSFTAIAGRTYRCVVDGGLIDSETALAASAYCRLRWTQSGAVTTSSTAFARKIVATPDSTNADLGQGLHAEGFITTATAGTVNVGFSLAAASPATNSVRLFATSIPPFVYVEDVGRSVTVNTLTF